MLNQCGNRVLLIMGILLHSLTFSVEYNPCRLEENYKCRGGINPGLSVSRSVMQNYGKRGEASVSINWIPKPDSSSRNMSLTVYYESLKKYVFDGSKVFCSVKIPDKSRCYTLNLNINLGYALSLHVVASKHNGSGSVNKDQLWWSATRYSVTCAPHDSSCCSINWRPTLWMRLKSCSSLEVYLQQPDTCHKINSVSVRTRRLSSGLSIKNTNKSSGFWRLHEIMSSLTLLRDSIIVDVETVSLTTDIATSRDSRIEINNPICANYTPARQVMKSSQKVPQFVIAVTLAAAILLFLLAVLACWSMSAPKSIILEPSMLSNRNLTPEQRKLLDVQDHYQFISQFMNYECKARVRKNYYCF